MKLSKSAGDILHFIEVGRDFELSFFFCVFFWVKLLFIISVGGGRNENVDRFVNS